MPYARTARRFGLIPSLFAFPIARALLLVATLVVAPAVTRAQTGHFTPAVVNFSSVAMGASSAASSLTFTFVSAGTIKAPSVLTQGAPNLDSTDAGTGTCTTNGTGHTYAAGDTCTVSVIFGPKHPGLRKGGVVLTNSSSSPIATAYIYGTGTGPQVIFSPPVKSVVASGFSYPQGVAVDESGSVFFADDNTWSVKEIMAGSGAVNVRGGGFLQTHGVALDGAGNIFVVDWSAMKEIVAAGGYHAVNFLTGCTYMCDVYKPVGVAVDGSGNAFVTNIYSRTLTEYLAAGGYATSNTLASGFTPYGVALDASGNVFVSDTTNNAVKEILAAGGYTSVNILGSGFSGPQGVAVDASGNVFVADTNHNAVKEIVAAGGYTTVKTLAGGFSGPQGVAVDGSGNVFVSDTGHNAVDKLDFSDPPSLTFATTNSGGTSTDSPRTVTVENDGNETLTFSAVDYPKDFPEASGVDTDCTSSTVLAPGESCTLSIDFSPQPSSADGAVTPLSEQVNITTDHLNLSNAVQSVTVKGTENAPAPFGHLDGAADARTGSTTVVQSDNLHVWGWAADPTDGAPVSQVQILIDGTAVGNATLGLSRPDVTNYPNPGWSFTYPASSLSLGAHTVSAVASDSLSFKATLGSAKFTAITPLSGYLDRAVDAQTRSTTVSQSGNLQVWGWAADLHDGAPVSQVQILIDGTAVGNSVLGLSRPDVKNYTNSGWSFMYAASSLSLGTHTASAVASDSLGFSTTLKILGTNSFTVATASTGPPFGVVDQAVDASTKSTNVGQAGYLEVSGWAADPQDGAPVSQVQVLVDGTAIGNATLGLSRPDVKGYPNSGWWLKVPASGLSLGTHSVSAIATDSLSKSTTLARTRSITVTTGP
jgi:streptogramin lyase